MPIKLEAYPTLSFPLSSLSCSLKKIFIILTHFFSRFTQIFFQTNIMKLHLILCNNVSVIYWDEFNIFLFHYNFFYSFFGASLHGDLEFYLISPPSLCRTFRLAIQSTCLSSLCSSSHLTKYFKRYGSLYWWIFFLHEYFKHFYSGLLLALLLRS